MTKWISDYWGPVEGELVKTYGNGNFRVQIAHPVLSRAGDYTYPVGSGMIFSPRDTRLADATVTELADEIQSILCNNDLPSWEKHLEVQGAIEPHTTKPTVESEVKKAILNTAPKRDTEVIFDAIKPFLKDEL